MNTPETVRPARRPAFSLREKIDVCRGVFALMVVTDHAFQVTWGVHPGSEALTRAIGHDVIGCLFETASVYVMGFFVLSGFCIEQSVARQLRGGEFPVRGYARARASRILPLYYAALLFAVAVEWLIAPARPSTYGGGLNAQGFVSQVLLLQNLSGTYGSFVPSWSITNECFYYALYGALGWALAGRPGLPARAGLALCAGGAVALQVVYATVAHAPAVLALGMLLGLGMVWFAGVFVAQRGEDWLRSVWVRRAARLWPLVLTAGLAWKFFHLPAQGLHLIPGLAFALMMLRFLDTERATAARPDASDPAPGRLRAWAVESLGLMSYPMYLFHAPLMMLVGSLLLRTGLAADARGTFALLLAVGVASGLALGWFVERPFMVWRAAWLRGRRSARPEARSPAVVPSPLAGLSR